MKYDISVCGMENDEALKAEEYIKGKDTVLEWGSGGTTLYFPQIVNTYVSMEHDSGWYEKVLPDILDNCEYYYVPIVDERLDSMLDPQAEYAMLCANDTQLVEYPLDGFITYWKLVVGLTGTLL